MSFAFGLEYRKETSESIPDAQQQTGQTFTGKTPAVKGSYEVSEAYIETRLPLLKDKPFAELLAIEGGFRASDNSVTGSSNSWRGGGEWAPVRDIRFRGMYAVSVRAPNVGELFTPQAPAISVPEDPCLAENVGGGPDPARRLANCTAILAPYGLDPLTYVLDPNFVGFAFGGVGGGNPNLNEEEATSITYGLVFNPRFLPNLTLSVDFYDIEIDDVIISPTPPSLADGCVDNFDTPDNELCGLVTRDNDPTSFGFGAIKSVNITTRNLAKLSTSGIDFQADYNWRIGPGALNARLIANYINSYKQKQLESAVHEDELVGGPRLPEIRGGLQLGYNTESLSLNYQIRYIDGVQVRDRGGVESGRDDRSLHSRLRDDQRHQCGVSLRHLRLQLAAHSRRRQRVRRRAAAGNAHRSLHGRQPVLRSDRPLLLRRRESQLLTRRS